MHTRIKRIGVVAAATLGLVVPAVAGALAAVVPPSTARAGQLVEVGPTAAENGFPVWYKDSNGTRLELCTSTNDPYCAVPAGSIPNPGAPMSFPDNYPDELFYQLAGGDLTTSTGIDLSIVMDLEAAFANTVQDGDQMVFGRVRIRAKDVPDGQTWRITHPYGIDEVTTADAAGINVTEDIGITPGAFGEALKSRIGPFLKWNPAVGSAAPAGYTGDPAVLHQVVGSPYATNFLRVERKNADGTWTSIGQTNLFSVQGKVATRSGLNADLATYTRDASGNGFVEVYATSDTGQSIVAAADQGIGYPMTSLRGQGSHYYGRMAMTSASTIADGKTIQLVNDGDVPKSTKSVTLVDKVAVTRAAYDSTAMTLTVQAASSDRMSVPTLSVAGYGPLTGGSAVFQNVAAPQPTITVTSSHGGSTTVPLDTSGAAIAPSKPVAAFTAPDTAQEGQTVNLDARGSTGDITSYNWSQSATDTNKVTLTGSGAQMSFVPTVAGDYHITLTVTGPGGTSEPMTRLISVGTATPAAMDTRAVANQTAVRGSRVTMDASATTGATSFAWTQTSGASAAPLTNGTSAKPTFTFPWMPLPTSSTGNPGYVRDNSPLGFEVAATGPSGTDPTPATVTVTPQAEVLSSISALYRTRGEWAVSGRSSLPAGQRVAIVLTGQPTGRLVATVTVDAGGSFNFRGGGIGAGAARQITVVSAAGGMVSAPLRVTT